MKCSLGISNCLEEISSLCHSVVFLCFFALISEEGNPAGLSSCSGGLSPLVELCVEPVGLCGRCTGVAAPLRVVPSPTGLPSKRGPGLGSLPFGPRSQASLQKAQGPGVCKLPQPPASRALCQAKRAPRAAFPKIPWMEEPGRLQSTGSQRVGHD